MYKCREGEVMKKTLSKVCMILTCAILCSSLSYAQELPDTDFSEELKEFMDESNILIDSFTINEFESLQKNPMTRSFSNITEFDKKVLEYNKYSDIELLGMGFTEEQIHGIKNYDYTNATRALVSSTLTVKVMTSGHTYVPKENKTYMGLHATFTWSSPVIAESKHTMINGVTGLSHRYTRTDHSQSAMITYRQPNGSERMQHYTELSSIGYNGLGSNYFTFPVQNFLYFDDVNNKSYFENVSVARLNSYFVTSGKEEMSEVLAGYTNSVLGITPSFSLSGSKINISFSPSQQAKILFQKHYAVDLSKDYGSVLKPID